MSCPLQAQERVAEVSSGARGARPPQPWAPGLTWAVSGFLGCHLHEQSHLLALGKRVASADPRQPHAEEQPGLAGDGLLPDPLPLRTLLLCEA